MKPTKCPPDAFCPAGSTEPQYCMEAFLYKVGSSCQLAPLAIVLLALLSAGEHHLLQPQVVPAVGSGWCMLQFLKSGFLLKVLLVARPFKRKQRAGVPSVAIKWPWSSKPSHCPIFLNFPVSLQHSDLWCHKYEVSAGTRLQSHGEQAECGLNARTTL